MIRHKIISACGIMLGLLYTGCASETQEPEVPGQSGDGTVSAELIIEIPSVYTLDEDETRAAPPGAGGNTNNTYNPLTDPEALEDIASIDRVRIVSFRSENGGDFKYDPNNDTIVNVDPSKDYEIEDGHRHVIARSRLKKDKDCRYRVVALAYSSTFKSSFPEGAFTFPAPGANNWFKLSCDTDPEESTFDSFHVTLNNDNSIANWSNFFNDRPSNPGIKQNIKNIDLDKVTETPQIFFGVCTSTAGGSEIIEYEEKDKYGSRRTDMPLTGLLKRGMAKVDIVVSPGTYKPGANTYNPVWVTLLADNPRISSKLTSYDDFLPQPVIGSGDNYKPVAYLPLSKDDVGQPKHITAWFLPGKTRLALRFRQEVTV